MLKLVLLCFFGLLTAQQGFVRSNVALHFVPKSVELVERVSTELRQKTGVSFVLFVVDAHVHNRQERLTYQQARLKELDAPFVAFFAYFTAQKIAIVTDPANLLDADQIFFERIAPFLPKKWGENMEENNARFSFALLNGYTYMADAVAQKYHVHLENNIQEENHNNLIKTTLYILLCSLLALFFYGYFFGARKHGH
ncbi:hypothetical protein ACFOPX_02115 [Helicobacter baculiformis]|uniref:Inner membrane protein n=1 Tax=Helicobacter baculiformis TaxID=427351 RepID=A0ABV7ZFK4_9HELI|nr:hypothetical protein [Helicobacter baculiformis]